MPTYTMEDGLREFPVENGMRSGSIIIGHDWCDFFGPVALIRRRDGSETRIILSGLLEWGMMAQRDRTSYQRERPFAFDYRSRADLDEDERRAWEDAEMERDADNYDRVEVPE